MPSYTTRHRSVPCARTLASVRLPPSFWTVSQARGWKLSLILAAGRMLGYNRFSVPQKQAWFPTSYQPGLVCFMELTFLCPDCGAVNHVQSLQVAERGACSACGAGRSLHHEVIEDGQLRACPWCATSDLYIQKDFPQGLGLSIVIVGFVISTIFWYLEKPILTYLVLLASRPPRHGALLPGSRRHDLLPVFEPDSGRGLQSRESHCVRSTWPWESVIVRNDSGLKSCGSGSKT